MQQKELSELEELIEIIKGSEIEQSIIDTQIKTTRFQKLKQPKQSASFLRVATSVLKELDPSANGYVTN